MVITRTLASCILLLGLGFTYTAHAEKIMGDELFDAVYHGCMQQIASDDQTTQAQKESYCRCMRGEISQNHDMETLSKVAAEHQAGGVAPDSMKKMQGLAQGCITKILGELPR